MNEPFHISVVILAAGQGTRMKSELPKVLHCLAGRPLLGHVIAAAQQLQAKQTVVVFGHGGDQVQQVLSQEPVQWVEQAQQLGTGHAVQQALPAIDENNIVLVLYGDVPLLRPDTLGDLIKQASDGRLALLTVHLDEPQGYGRIVRDAHGHVQRIVEEKDASDEDKAIREVNTGILAVNARALKGWLNRLNNNNAQGEYYLTDIIEMAVHDGLEVKTTHPTSEEEVLGVNSRSQLAYLERTYQRNIAEQLMAQGVTLVDPARLDIRGDVKTGRDVTLDANVLLEGDVEIGNNVAIGPNCVIKNSRLADGVKVQAMSVIEDAIVGADSEIGPFARVRPGSVFAERTKVGNFVEIKNAQVGKGSKINHLSYVGDTEMGAGVNIGAGTITCNYDGANKHRTVIGDNAFIGSDTQLVAPVKVGKGATIGAGSTITRDAPEDKLTLSRPKQTTVENWQRPVKKPKQ